MALRERILKKGLNSPVRINSKPSSVHEHGEGSPVGEIMAKEIVQEQIVGRLLGPIVVTSINHGADGRRLGLVLVVRHWHFPNTRVGMFGTGTNLAILRGLIIQSVGKQWRIDFRCKKDVTLCMDGRKMKFFSSWHGNGQ